MGEEQGPQREAGFPQGSVGATRGVRGRKRSGACPLSYSVGTGASGAHRSALCRVKGQGSRPLKWSHCRTAVKSKVVVDAWLCWALCPGTPGQEGGASCW